jgi:hypothetical protein
MCSKSTFDRYYLIEFQVQVITCRLLILVNLIGGNMGN